MNVVNVEGLGIDERVMAIEDDERRAAFLEVITGPPPPPVGLELIPMIK